MTNRMKDVAKLIGVEIGEEFIIKNHCGENIVKITAFQGLMRREAGRDDWFIVSGNGLNNILLGQYEIERLPFKPKDGDTYWSYNGVEFRVMCLTWRPSPTHYCRLNSNIVFRTEEEAIKERPRVFKEWTGRTWKESDY